MTPEIEHSIAYLASDAAQESIAIDTYWPKWNSPWWHMLLLFELGEARRIPQRAVDAMIAGLAKLPYKWHPTPDNPPPPNANLHRDFSCHCALGSMYRILHACGVNVDEAVPWALPWFVENQMRDGGLNCDGDAYGVRDECPSSMVGTIAPLEAMLVALDGIKRPFVDRAARFLIERRLTDGSPTKFNAEERDAAPAWRLPTFPRFYFYDVIRGLAALVDWAQQTNQTIPREAIEHVTTELDRKFPDGTVRIERRALDGKLSLGQPASTFPLLDRFKPGDVSVALTRQWATARSALPDVTR